MPDRLWLWAGWIAFCYLVYAVLKAWDSHVERRSK